jgi:hypothetical protein
VGTNRQVGDEQTVGTNKYGGNERTGIVDLSKAVGKHSLGAHRAPNLKLETNNSLSKKVEVH